MRESIEGGNLQSFYLLRERLPLFMRYQVGPVYHRLVDIEKGAEGPAYPSASLMQRVRAWRIPARIPSVATENRYQGAMKSLLGAFPILCKIFEVVRQVPDAPSSRTG